MASLQAASHGNAGREPLGCQSKCARTHHSLFSFFEESVTDLASAINAQRVAVSAGVLG